LNSRVISCLIALNSIVVLPSSFAGELTFRSSELRTHLIELYTSEGCSSCPPADAWVHSLNDNAGLWKDFVPVAFHVDYWDYIGWRDPFASSVYSKRQRSYAGQWKNNRVYTPCFVFNGREWRPRKAIEKSRDKAGILDARVQGNLVYITFTPEHNLARPRRAWLAQLSGEVSSEVKRGENAGRTLVHDFVSLDLQHALMKRTDGRWETILKQSNVDDAMAMAVWVSDEKSFSPEQATGGWLNKEGRSRGQARSVNE